MRGAAVTRERMDELLHFLPLFEAPGRRFVKAVGGGEPTADGEAVTTYFPIYESDVLEFFRLAGQICWTDFDYDPRAAGEMLTDEARIADASLEEIKTLLTYCVRGERFSDGHWAMVLESGRISALLRRLRVLRGDAG